MSRPEQSSFARCALHRARANRRRWLAMGFSFTGLSFAHASFAAGALPQGGAYVAGAGEIASQSNGLLITQPGSTRGVIAWNSFSIGRNNSVTFDNGSGATLNRVTGGSPSSILGRLSATGSLYVINPQGIVVGSSGVVTTGGRFVASTLDIGNDAFMKGSGALILSGDSDASVANLGRISSSGGDVFLVARGTVTNAGAVSAPNGTAELATGGQVLLQDSGSSRQVFVQTGSHGTVVNQGQIKAAQVSLQAVDGNIYALAGGGTRMRAAGTATRDGHVWLVADGGKVDARGTIEAANADGKGGTVDTIADRLRVGRVDVHAAQWNLASPVFSIDPETAASLSRNLSRGTSVTVSATDPAAGDLTVSSGIRWTGNAALALDAAHSVSIASRTTVANSGAGSLTLRADSAGANNGGSVSNKGTIDWLGSTGTVTALYDMNGSYSPGTIRSNADWSAAAFSGLKTQVTAYRLVNSLTDLASVSQNLAGSYALGKDIAASQAPAVAQIGATGTPFTGEFDGMGQVIDGIAFAPGNVGLFATIGTTGVVRNLGIANASGSTFPPKPAGLVAAVNAGLITNTYSSGTITLVGLEGALGGGLVGQNEGLIERSSSSANVHLPAGTGGGLVGVNNGKIRQSFASGTVGGSSRAVMGGLVGVNSGIIAQSYATGSVSGMARGGLAASNSGTIQESFSTTAIGPLPASGPHGGVVGSNSGSVASNVFWDTETSGTPDGGPGVSAANGLTTAQMSAPTSFGHSWDFSRNGVWAMPTGATHPVLRWELEH
ncbi:two-partner secretion domain-containing protein [Paraburkholderia graminis]|uniref:Filamentous hemagglutinin family protein n=1 Tax=Paraburkholderia graminis TaxID=60548 RepID=A0ABD5CTA5_9BURK|nr:filamentous hemagglutinin N-terminal domain-containing protein [Paraburkholderia graminis]MDR6207860.1 filamentous hemagglutinin family protein [Paraburkholderia graminis]